MTDNLGCGHCGRPLDLCDCGADYEIVYRPHANHFEPDGVSPGLLWLALVGAIALLLLTASMIS